MYTSDYTIQSQILDSWEAFKDADEDFIDDNLSVMAENACPVYYADIIKDWAEMPSEFNDSWQDCWQLAPEMGILNLMAIDLETYYRNTYTRIYQAVLEEEKRLAEEEEN